MTGGTPAAAAMRVSPAPWDRLKSICLRSAPTTVDVGAAAEEQRLVGVGSALVLGSELRHPLVELLRFGRRCPA